MPDNTRYEDKPGRHRHKCSECDCVWEHGNENLGLLAPHECPQCQRPLVHRWHYLGIEAPQFVDHYLKEAAN